MSLFFLNSNLDNSWSTTFDLIGQLFFVFLVLLFVIGVIYLLSKILGSNKINMNKMSSINIIERRNLGLNTHLLIIKVNSDFFLLSQTKERIELICKLDDFVEKEENFQFDSFINKFLNKSDKNEDNNEK